MKKRMGCYEDLAMAIFVFYVLGCVGAFIIFALIEKRAREPEGFPVILLMSVIWPIMVVIAPIVFGLSFLNDKYNQFVGK
ncbi:hypothetical protein [Xenorhabdus littoralis]|uniref:hypothetical protein n=1 Tax=Xenorhabdus littoralis TaxID=2582835 RepID=UPI0029E81504|nr:hypothetical protein [Xenorhabdus sp. psl]MDX7992594.1 hypothetical protein [Xenorhabdus sp. psl]